MLVWPSPSAPVGIARVRKGQVADADTTSVKNKKVAELLQQLPHNSGLTYLLVEEGTKISNLLQSKGIQNKIYFQIGELLAEMQKTGYFHNDFIPLNLILYKGQMKLIDVYHTVSDPKQESAFLEIEGQDIEHHGEYIIPLLDYLFPQRSKVEDRDKQPLLEKFLEGYLSIKDKKYSDSTLKLIRECLEENDT